MTTTTENLNCIVATQLESLDDTDCYASAWADAIQAANESHEIVSWGGRGKGGRGLSRRTFQPHSVSLENVRLEYVSESGLPGKVLLDAAPLKIRSQRVYALVGRNGCGKSTLLRRIDAGKIPGFAPHLSSMYIPQEVVPEPDKTPLDFVLRHHNSFLERSKDASKSRIESLEAELEGLDMTSEDDTQRMEELCEEISMIQDISDGHDLEVVQQQAQGALAFFGINNRSRNIPMERLSGGERKKVVLACALFCPTDLVLLDEPTNFLDVEGLVELRRFISTCTDRNSIVILVSHDVDLINDVATDVIYFHNQTLTYYPGNYRDFVGYKRQNDLHLIRENAALVKKRDAMMQTIDNLKKQPIPKRGGAKKKGSGIESAKKKLEKLGLTRDEKGHRWTSQTAGTGIKLGSINSLDATTRGKMSHSEMLKSAKLSIAPVPDKAVQFVFRNVTSSWGEPLIMAMDVGHGFGVETNSTEAGEPFEPGTNVIVKKPGFLFDCVDLCVDEGSITCILGPNGSGKSTLLRILTKKEQPLEGKVHHAHNVKVAHFDQHAVDDLIDCNTNQVVTALSLLVGRFPEKTDKDIRGELSSFGLSPKQASTNVRFLSGGERSRLCLAALMLEDPHVLVMDEPTSHLDVESVEALIYGLKHWNGTLVLVSHDANFLRSLEGNCHVIMQDQGKIRRIPDGIDSYLKTFRF